MVLVLAFAVGAALLVSPSGRSSGGSFPGKNGVIVLQVAEVGGSEFALSSLYLFNPTVSGEFVRLTRGHWHDANPAWSADGRLIAFNSNRRTFNKSEDMDIWVVRPDGSALRRLTGGRTVDLDPSWSPDGRRIAFTSDRSGSLDIWTMRASGSGLVQVTTARARDEEPRWSPDGKRIAFSSYRHGNQEIYVMNADGSQVVRLTKSPGRDRHPNWSPDGTRIAFDSDPSESGDFDIFTVKPNGAGLRRLTGSSAIDSRPAWSPDGRQIVYQSEDAQGERHLLWVHPDGTAIDGDTYGNLWHTSTDWQAVDEPDRCLTRGTIFDDEIDTTEAEQDDVMCMLAGNDRASSWAGDDVIEGGPGNDTLDGGSGNDRLVGGPGRDLLFCGVGRDVAIVDRSDKVATDCEAVRKAG